MRDMENFGGIHMKNRYIGEYPILGIRLLLTEEEDP